MYVIVCQGLLHCWIERKGITELKGPSAVQVLARNLHTLHTRTKHLANSDWAKKITQSIAHFILKDLH